MLPVEAIINIVVAVVFFSFWLFFFVILYHLARFGIGTLPKKLSALFLLGGIALFTWSLILFIRLDISKLQI